MDSFLKQLFGLSRPQKRIIQVLVDVILVVGSFVIAMTLRLDSFGFMSDPGVWMAMALVLSISLPIFVKLGFYRAVVRYITSRAVWTISIGVFTSALVLLLVTQLFSLQIPRSVPAIYALLALFSIGGVRFVLRSVFQRRQMSQKAPVIIYGAGASGRQVLSALQQGHEYAPVAFVDDADSLHGTEIGGFRVHHPDDLHGLIARYGAKAVLLAMPSALRAERKVILDRLEPFPVQIQTIPGMVDLVSGKARVSEIRDIAIEDLLGRDPVPPHECLMSANISGKVVMVTGAGGSIGSELCRQILSRNPKVLVLFEISEPSLYAIDMELNAIARARQSAVRIVPLLGTVQNAHRVASVLSSFGVQTIYHAAAYKHVPLVEENVGAGVQNNVFGTLTLAQAAVKAKVETFILISTDKAVRPTNIMGATKRMAELICQAHAARSPGTRFSMVRFGNVLGSSGSVIPLFRAQIEAGGPVTVTHPEITRYFMTIPEASQLVIQAGAMAHGGDVFVLDMGASTRIVDLAARLIRLSGLKPYVLDDGCLVDGVPDRDGDIAITFNGLRPGEKLYEELLIGASSSPTDHPRILTADEVCMSWPQLEPLLAQLRRACAATDIAAIRSLLQAAPTGYVPSSDIVDLIWQEADSGTFAGEELPDRIRASAHTRNSAHRVPVAGATIPKRRATEGAALDQGNPGVV